ncbi:hypothetical protein L107_08458 [Cyanobium sp. Copco_Reservoir_LC18]|uniref:hypothetical protein n=1 Tax=Cyanobium sp. Copco_Reservoir_LC18 TaxID=1328305 RepID=UPI00135BD315|nr:hypothetical protein [Cyanobium sp. Copco_Reservoir_LC18]KAF0653608.1 hypothetical protein L107_08458 [Cyanobium sp. Copco_Reservoir_LC18]
MLTPGQPVAPVSVPPPTSFSFGEVPASHDPAPIVDEAVADDLGHALASAPPGAAAAPGAAATAVPGPTTASPTSLAITTTGPDAQQLEMELAAARDELKALHEMLEDLPEIFERKFQQRLATVMEHQKHLLADNQALRDRLYSLNPAAADGPPPGSGRPQPLLVPTVARKQGWGQALKRALRLGGPDAASRSDREGRGGEGAPQKISRHDDGRPITA